MKALAICDKCWKTVSTRRGMFRIHFSNGQKCCNSLKAITTAQYVILFR